MATQKVPRSKPLSSMTPDELKAYVKAGKDAGYTSSTSKDIGKAIDLLKVQSPDKYGANTVASATTKLQTSTTPETQQRLGIAPVTATGEASMTTGGNTTGGNTTGVGVTGSSSGGGANGNFDLNQVYNNAMGSQEIKALEDTVNKKKQALATAQAGINDNPWYSEATRIGKSQKLSMQAQQELANLNDELAQKKADAQAKINIALKQYDINNQEYQNNLQKLNMLVSSGAINNASGSDLAQIALKTGLTTAMLKGIQAKASANQVKPLIKDYTDNNGNVSLVVIDPMTGQVISKQGIGTVAGAKTSGGSANNDMKIQQAFESSVQKGIDQLQKGEDWGTVWNRIKTTYPDAPDTVIDNMLGANFWREAGAFENFMAKKNSGGL